MLEDGLQLKKPTSSKKAQGGMHTKLGGVRGSCLVPHTSGTQAQLLPAPSPPPTTCCSPRPSLPLNMPTCSTSYTMPCCPPLHPPL